ncbi:unnamed protein product [Caretta caretta]
MKLVVDQIDTLTSDLQLEDEMTDSSKTDTLNSSSSSTTASSLEKAKVRANAPLIKPPAHPSAILTVLRKPNPPPPPPRLTPVKCEDPHRPVPSANPVKTNGTLLRNGGLPGGPNKIPNGDVFCIPNSNLDKVPMHPLIHRPDKDRCPQTGTRERVRFSEKVQYHGYCPDCDVRNKKPKYITSCIQRSGIKFICSFRLEGISTFGGMSVISLMSVSSLGLLAGQI